MSDITVKLPWEVLGQRLNEFRAMLDEQLKALSSDDRVAHLEITIYQQSGDASEPPTTEYFLAQGAAGLRFPPDEFIKEDDLDSDEKLDVELAPIFERFIDQLQADVNNLQEGVNFTAGTRAYLVSPNPSYRCTGIRCEYRPEFKRYYKRRYYLREGLCRKVWLTPC